MDKNAPAFSLQHIMYKTQFEKNLSHNVYINGQWGSYRHLKLEPIQNIEADHAFLDQVVWGDFSSLRWVEGPLSPHKYTFSQSILILRIKTYQSNSKFVNIL